MRKAHQREVAVTRESFASALEQLTGSDFRLGANASVNDVWLAVEFADREFEEGVARYIHRLLGRRYSRLQNTPVDRHC